MGEKLQKKTVHVDVYTCILSKEDKFKKTVRAFCNDTTSMLTYTTRTSSPQIQRTIIEAKSTTHNKYALQNWQAWQQEK